MSSLGGTAISRDMVIIKTFGSEFWFDKAALIKKSNYFRSILSDLSNRDNAIHLEGAFDDATVLDLVNYLYTGREPDHLDETCFSLLEAAHLCQLKELKDMCVEPIVERLTADNIVQALVLSQKCQMEDLLEGVLMTLKEDIAVTDPTQLPGWDALDLEMAKKLLSSFLKYILKKKKN